MCPKPVIASCDSEAGAEVVADGPDGRLPPQWCPDGRDETGNWNADDEDDIEPVDVLVPVLLRHRSLGDVRLLGVVFLVPHRLLGCRFACW